jgi:hypothetical protein
LSSGLYYRLVVLVHASFSESFVSDDGSNMFLRNTVIYLQVHTELEPGKYRNAYISLAQLFHCIEKEMPRHALHSPGNQENRGKLSTVSWSKVTFKLVTSQQVRV